MTRGGRLSFASTAVLAVLAAILAVVFPAGAASALAAYATGNGAGADHPGMILPVGSAALPLRWGGCTYDGPGQLVRHLVAGNASDGSAIAWTGSGGSLSHGGPVASAVPVFAAEETGGVTNVFRVESPGNARLDISPSGDVAIKGNNALFLNFGDEARAQEFLANRLEQGYEGTVIKSFQVPSSYVDELRASAVPESMARQFPDSPFVVDVNKAADQFGLRAANFPELLRNIIPGSGYSP